MKQFFTAICLLAAGCDASVSDRDRQERAIAITHVTVIDTAGGPSQSGMTVVIEGSRIKALGKSETTALPKDAREIDATGKYLIPGLWDMHVHTLFNQQVADTFFPLFIANGITGVRDMNGDITLFHQLKERINSGLLLGPRIVAAGAAVDGVKGNVGSIGAMNEAEAKQAVDSLKKQSADFVKVVNLLSRETYFSLATHAHAQGLPVAGHVPIAISPEEASNAGQHSIEHLDGILISCSQNEVQLRSSMMETIKKSDPSLVWRTRARAEAQAVGTYDEEKCARLFTVFVENGTWQVPTLGLMRATAFMDDSNFTNDTRLMYAPPFLKQLWSKGGGAYEFLVGKYTADDFFREKRTFQRRIELVAKMHRSGVAFMVGTDTIDPYIFPGFALHDELALLAEAGFTPREALQAATYNPAKYLGTLESMGTIGIGKFADLVLLDADPLRSIHNTQKISAVVANGKFLDRSTLDQMMAIARKAAQQN
ncbi:MAG: amidohydrolase family protein [Acidobacteria bacterium]|nr:amidohydrolase family protein [Acidobacteriota bacterium]